jgi:uncharacterized protein YdeI (YjbR/CyaY-like superfamily)
MEDAMNDDAAELRFETRSEFRIWLEKNHGMPGGVWIVFEKGSRRFSANDALEEAICFGWIDGVMKTIDGARYKKYFSRRKDKAKWSEKNIRIFGELERAGLLTEHGVNAFKPASAKGGAAERMDRNVENIRVLSDALQGDGEAATLFENTPPSRKKQLAGFYAEAKTEATREKRKAKIIEALITNDKGMLY